MTNQERGRGDDGRGNNQPPPALDQQAFVEAISATTAALLREGVIASTITQAGVIGNQGGLSNLQRSEAHFPPALEGGGNLEVTGHYSRLVGKDANASSKRKESQPSSCSRKRLKTYVPHEPQARGCDYQGQGQG